MYHKRAQDSQGTKKVGVLQIYYEAPMVEDVPPGVFGGTGVPGSSWTEQLGTDGARVFQHSGVSGANSEA